MTVMSVMAGHQSQPIEDQLRAHLVREVGHDLPGPFPQQLLIVDSGGVQEQSRFTASPSIVSSSTGRSCSSTSMAVTSAPAVTSWRVSVPVPGPTSSTRSPRLIPAVVTILLVRLGSARKCWPSDGPRPEAVPSQKHPHLVEGLSRQLVSADLPKKTERALAVVCSATVSTGIDQTRARAAPTSSTQAGSFGSCRWGGGAR